MKYVKAFFLDKTSKNILSSVEFAQTVAFNSTVQHRCLSTKQTVYIQMRWLIPSHLIRIYTVCNYVSHSVLFFFFFFFFFFSLDRNSYVQK